MKRMFVLAALLFAGLAGAFLRMPHPASACTGPGPVENLLGAVVIFEGRVTAATPTGPAAGGLRPHTLTFEVTRGHKGAVPGQTLTANAQIPSGDVPVMCPQFPRDLQGKSVVLGLLPDSEHAGELFASAWAGYVGGNLSGPDYELMAKLAELHADSDPSAPQLLIEPDTAGCGDPITISGKRFVAGRYLLRYSFGGRAIAVVESGEGGTFTLPTVMRHHACGNPHADGSRIGVHASQGPQSYWSDPQSLVEIAGATVVNTTGFPVPSLTVTPDPARCTDRLEINGEGFVPGEPLHIDIGEGTIPTLVSADTGGRISLSSSIPPAACEESFIRIAARQAGFEEFLPSFAVLAEATLVRTGERPPPAPAPGPPDVGNSTPHQLGRTSMVIPAAFMGAGAALAIAAAGRNMWKRRT